MKAALVREISERFAELGLPDRDAMNLLSDRLRKSMDRKYRAFFQKGYVLRVDSVGPGEIDVSALKPK